MIVALDQRKCDDLDPIVCLFVCFESHEQIFSYLATVTIGSDRAANLDLCLAVRVLLRALPTATRDLRF
jgi:hypothetical protein